ncbi:unnamed protein product [Caenorhabditis angaria]|uniref:BACK domain-containing protein n=1 Tax=Caenorhabditis angaria TaxID=860376 RepID=A0A9P1MYJ8_9PELO|nr:unnamed protein product [Caenorhabditis angaria]
METDNKSYTGELCRSPPTNQSKEKEKESKSATKSEISSKSTKSSSKSTKTSNSKGSDRCAVIRLIGNRSVYHVSVDDFVKVSKLIKQQQNSGNLMTSIDLNRFSDQSILAFVNFIQNGEIRTSLTYYALTELITLAKTFWMKELKISLEDCLVEASRNSEADLLQSLIICDVTHISPDTERQIQLAAMESFEKMVALPDFHRLPYHQLCQILSSCELTVTQHEMFIVDVILLWLSGQRNVNSYAPGLFLCVRTKLLSPVDKTLIIERINILGMPEKVVRLVRNILESTNGLRCCVDAAHIAKKNFTRCGQAATLAAFGTQYSALPLSRPNFKIKIKKTKETKAKPVFHPDENPKVMDLIQNHPKSTQKSQNSRKKFANSKKRKKMCMY